MESRSPIRQPVSDDVGFGCRSRSRADDLSGSHRGEPGAALPVLTLAAFRDDIVAWSGGLITRLLKRSEQRQPKSRCSQAQTGRSPVSTHRCITGDPRNRRDEISTAGERPDVKAHAAIEEMRGSPVNSQQLLVMSFRHRWTSQRHMRAVGFDGGWIAYLEEY
jgi:hypothetical protein